MTDRRRPGPSSRPTTRSSAAQLCDAWTADVDRWLAELFDDGASRAATRPGLALVAVGGYGRGELSLQSDIDVLLLHTGRDDIGELADRLWYPIWDAGHEARPRRAHGQGGAGPGGRRPRHRHRRCSHVRHLAGDRRSTDELAGKAELQWRKRAKRWLGALADAGRASATAGPARWRSCSSPTSRRAGAGCATCTPCAGRRRPARSCGTTTTPASTPPTTRCSPCGSSCTAAPAGPATGCCCRSRTRWPAALGYADADALMRTIAPGRPHHRLDQRRRLGPHRQLAGRPARPAPGATAPSAAGLVLRDGEVHIRRRRRRRPPTRALPLRAAAVAAANGHPHRPRARSTAWRPRRPAPADPWPEPRAPALVRPAARRPAGAAAARGARPAGRVGALPARVAGRCGRKPQRNAYHRFTVDRHLWEAAVGAGGPGRPGPPARPAGARRACSTTSARA